MFAKILALSVAALVSTAAGPPWISIEYPVNPLDQSMRGAFLLVHTFHHAEAIAFSVEGTAEGIVNGERRTVKLVFAETSRTGVYSLRRQWPTDGVWTLVIKAGATAVVEIGNDGEIASVRVPSRQERGWTIPTDVSMDDIDKALRTRASALARRD
ncbi:MAG TPA: hypothetical protein VK467_09020 [Gemmatimonadales bacterium]|nr:hypothetical protein [Gemmatimonadales bacterium]